MRGFGALVGFVRLCVENAGPWDLSDVMSMSRHVMGNLGMGWSGDVGSFVILEKGVKYALSEDYGPG